MGDQSSKSHASRGRWTVGADGRRYLEVPDGRDPMEKPGETIIDKLAADHLRSIRAAEARDRMQKQEGGV